MADIEAFTAEPQTPSTTSLPTTLYSTSEPPPSLTQSASSVPSPLSTGSPCERILSAVSFRPRGYVRPQATTFSDSARNRHSVLRLGSIAHIQHYFARTGLLEGKGGHVAQQPIKIASDGDKENTEPSFMFADFNDDLNVIDLQSLHPTASTYRQAPVLAQPLPSTDVLRRELLETLADVKSVLAGLQPGEGSKDEGQASSQGWHEVEGSHVLDLVTLALRAAKEYYVCHTCPARLFKLRSERELRADAHKILDVLKIVASRNFRGGFRVAEISSISEWVAGIADLVSQDETTERAEQYRHEMWPWMHGDWSGRQRERERSFLSSFDEDLKHKPMPAWLNSVLSAPDPPQFLLELRNGVKLIKLHNAVVQASKRRFGEIVKHHTDTEKPYRRSDNLRYWIKAAELRWEVKLEVPVNALVVAGGGDLKVWEAFDEALLKWCRAVREELTAEYADPRTT